MSGFLLLLTPVNLIACHGYFLLGSSWSSAIAFRLCLLVLQFTVLTAELNLSVLAHECFILWAHEPG